MTTAKCGMLVEVWRVHFDYLTADRKFVEVRSLFDYRKARMSVANVQSPFLLSQGGCETCSFFFFFFL